MKRLKHHDYRLVSVIIKANRKFKAKKAHYWQRLRTANIDLNRTKQNTRAYLKAYNASHKLSEQIRNNRITLLEYLYEIACSQVIKDRNVTLLHFGDRHAPSFYVLLKDINYSGLSSMMQANDKETIKNNMQVLEKSGLVKIIKKTIAQHEYLDRKTNYKTIKNTKCAVHQIAVSLQFFEFYARKEKNGLTVQKRIA